MARRALLAILVLLLVPACSRRQAREPGPVRIVVTIAPLKGIIAPLLPRDAEITILLPPGRSEHGWEPRPSDLKAISRSDLFIMVGLGLETGVERLLPKMPGVQRKTIVFADAVNIEAGEESHSHPHDGDDDHEAAHAHGVDPHLWLDPVLVRRFAAAIVPRVKQACVDAGAAADVEGAATDLDARLALVHQRHEQALAPLRGKSIVTHHAAFGRLAERYGLKVAEVIRPVEGVEPSPGQVAAVIDAVREAGVSAIFVEPQYGDRAAERIAAQAGVQVGRLDPLGQGDWFAMMQANLDELVEKLSQ